MDLSWLKTLAPTVATALGGPLAGIAVDVVGKALGMSDATADKIEAALTTATMTSEQVAGLQRAELELKAHEQELGFKFAELDAADRKGARDMQVANKSVMPAAITGGVGLAFFITLWVLFFFPIPAGNRDTIVYMCGQLAAAFAACLAFWVGTTRHSEDKTNILAKAQPVK